MIANTWNSWNSPYCLSNPDLTSCHLQADLSQCSAAVEFIYFNRGRLPSWKPIYAAKPLLLFTNIPAKYRDAALTCCCWGLLYLFFWSRHVPSRFASMVQIWPSPVLIWWLVDVLFKEAFGWIGDLPWSARGRSKSGLHNHSHVVKGSTPCLEAITVVITINNPNSTILYLPHPNLCCRFLAC